MESEKEEEVNEIDTETRKASIMKFLLILLILFFIWYGFDLAER